MHSDDPESNDLLPMQRADMIAAANGDVMDADAAESEQEARALLERLRAEHRRIDQEITALQETGVSDMLKVRRMKKIKLSIKDQIQYLENQLTPDIIA
jgi:hypothetical protein